MRFILFEIFRLFMLCDPIRVLCNTYVAFLMILSNVAIKIHRNVSTGEIDDLKILSLLENKGMDPRARCCRGIDKTTASIATW
jgi:hypothetical protein